MRIVHDVDAPMTASAGFDGNRFMLWAATDAAQNHPDLPPQMFLDAEEIEIEGTERYVLQLLEDWTHAMKMSIAARDRKAAALLDAPAVAPAQLAPFAPSNRDWAEDAPHENGNYQNRCIFCHKVFIGHKRRVCCKLCDRKEPIVPTQPTEEADYAKHLRTASEVVNSWPKWKQGEIGVSNPDRVTPAPAQPSAIEVAAREWAEADARYLAGCAADKSSISMGDLDDLRWSAYTAKAKLLAAVEATK